MNLCIKKYFFVFLLTIFFTICSLQQLKETEDFIHIRKRSELVLDSIHTGIFLKENYTLFSLSGFEEKTQDNSKKLVCYYVWEHMKSETLLPKDIDPHICSHILLGFSTVNNSILVPSKPDDIKGYEWTVSLKEKNPKLKVMLSAGGGSEFSEAVSSTKNRTKFIYSILKLLNKYEFDGFDIDWEFPAWKGSPAMDRVNFIKFLEEFRLVDENKYLLSVAVAAPKTIIDISYDIPSIAKYVDFVNLMSYDYHDYKWYMPFTGHNSPLFRRSIEKGYFATLNTAWSALYWVEKGLPKSKLLVGIPTYSHSYELADSNDHGFDAPAIGFGLGEMTFYQVCEFLNKGGIRVFDNESQVPYAYQNFNWIAYDDYESVVAKANWIKRMNFGGAMTYDLNCDDWKGTCNKEKTFPLHRLIRSILIDKVN